MDMEKICSWCGGKFECAHHSRRYCSPSCQKQRMRQAAMERMRRMRACDCCGAKFDPYSEEQTLCGFCLNQKALLRVGWNKVIEAKACKRCNKPLGVITRTPNGYCSEACERRAKTELRRKKAREARMRGMK